MKRWLGSDRMRVVLCALVAAYIWLVHRTGRWREINGAAPRRFWREKQPFIVAFWHGRLLMFSPFWPRSQVLKVLISRHRDGELIANSVAHFGLKAVRGSTSKGAMTATRGLLKAIRQGENVAITPDGPRGPRMRATDGIVRVAQRAGVPILPMSLSARPARVLKSWDRFLMPYPFTRGVCLWGEPIEVARDTDEAGLEAKRAEVERALTDLARRADEMTGLPFALTAPEPLVPDEDSASEDSASEETERGV